MRPSLRAALAAAATTAVLLPQLASADTISPDGDIATNGPNLTYPSAAHACSTRGTPVTGEIEVFYNGNANDHFAAGEAIDVTFKTPAGVTVTADPTNVPDPWEDRGRFTITLHTTVTTASAGGKVELTVTGNESNETAGANEGGGKPNFQVSVNCPDDPADTTAPTISLDTGTPNGQNNWYVSSPVTVTYSANDDVAVTGVSCTDNGGTPFAVSGGSFTVSGEGTHNLSCVASDAAGNNSAAAVGTVRIDTVAPGISGPVVSPGAAGSDGTNSWWNVADVSLTWTCSDSTSGPVDVSIVKHLTAEGAGQTESATCQDQAGNTNGPSTSGPVNIDRTAPALNISGAASGSYDICATGGVAPTRPTFAPTDSLSGVNPSSAVTGDSWTVPANPSGVGSYVYEAHAADYATNSASESRNYSVVYGGAFSGILQPINADGTSRFRLGSTVPVKFRLTCSGVPITNAVSSLTVRKTDSLADPGVDEAISTSAATTGNLFRYSDGQYIFNLSTKLGYTNPGQTTAIPFSTGSWQLTINLDDGSRHSVLIQLVK